MNRAFLVVLISLGFAAPACADYFAIGKIEGNVCWSFGVSVCRLHTISAVKGDDGKLYEVGKQFTTVTEYKESSGRCWITTKDKGRGLISWGINAIKQPVFLEQTSAGKYEELDVDYVTFKCVKG